MRRFLACLTVLMALAGCNTVATLATLDAQNPVTLTRVFQLKSAYNIAFQKPARAYAELPLCRTGQTTVRDLCAYRSVVVELYRVDQAAEGSIDKLETFVRANPRLNAGALYTAAQTAITEATRIKNLYGVKG